VAVASAGSYASLHLARYKVEWKEKGWEWGTGWKGRTRRGRERWDGERE